MKLTRSTARRMVFAALLLAGTVFGVTSTAPATEAAPQGLCTYYDNNGNVVGQRGEDCCGNPVNWGITTPRVQCYVEVCVWCPPVE